jgi:redox-sensitive bicupin YhaK (pirin superfamily)
MTAIAHLIRPKAKDLGDGFIVRRALPAIEARNVGPFIFLDEMGPVTFAPGQGLDVRPHPHIGLATVTYLFEGAIEHRDSLGTVQVIRPGDVNWMTAGRGIVHSERSPPPRQGGPIWGVQFWAALPKPDEETDPAFHHVPAKDLPVTTAGGVSLRVIIGAWDDLISPVKTFSPMLFADLNFAAGAAQIAPNAVEERALYVMDGVVEADGAPVAAGELAILGPGAQPNLSAAAPARAILFGGSALDGPRKLWWNFVSSRPERIEQAKRDWRDQAMGTVPGEVEWIDLPTA